MKMRKMGRKTTTGKMIGWTGTGGQRGRRWTKRGEETGGNGTD